MFDTSTIIAKASTSKRHLRLLNIGLSRMIPFNRPHGIRITEVSNNSVKTLLPYRRRNFNHIKGLHACGLATISEFSTGLVLLNCLDSKKYRIIMQKMEMNYHYQGKMDAHAYFEASDEWLKEKVIDPLENEPSVIVDCEVKVHDTQGNHLTTGNIFWQIKSWDKVKTKA